MWSKRRILFVLLLLLLLLLIIMTQCDPPFGPGPTPEPGTVVCTPTRDPERFSTTSYFVARQVILTGQPAALDDVARELNLEPLVDCDLGYLADGEQITVQTLSLPPQLIESSSPSSFEVYNRIVGQLRQGQADALALRLYLVPAELDVIEVVRRINERPEANIFAEPNYLTGHLAKTPCSNPFGVEGSPFGVEGSPFGVEGSEGGGMGLDADPDAFWDQWAFERIGAGAYKDSNIQQQGSEVRVAVFDTSPFTVTGDVAIADITPALNLRVVAPATAITLTTTETISPSIKDHGLFVAGLIHGVAPASEIHLIRVLDDKGCGDLFALSQALHEFVAEHSNEEGRLDGVVMNMSLGVLQPRDATDQNLPEEILALETALLEAYQRGAVLVAAAGNDSVGDDYRFAMELPAAYEYVIGVAASDIENQPTCYSNQGDVVAPGGGAEPDLTEDPPRCLAQADLCPLNPEAPGQCDYGLISLATTSGTKYAYWVGTSFATPLVSGVAALAYEGDSQAQVYGDIFNGVQPIGTNFGPGIVNVANSLSP